MSYIHTMEYYLATKKKAALILIQYGKILKTLFCVKEASHRGPHIV